MAKKKSQPEENAEAIPLEVELEETMPSPPPISDELVALRAENELLRRELSALQGKIGPLESIVASLPAALAACVVLDGQPQEIEMRDTVSAVVEAFKKRYLDENHTCLVLRRLGG